MKRIVNMNYKGLVLFTEHAITHRYKYMTSERVMRLCIEVDISKCMYIGRLADEPTPEREWLLWFDTDFIDYEDVYIDEFAEEIIDCKK